MEHMQKAETKEKNSKVEKKKLELMMAVILVCAAVFLSTNKAVFTGSAKTEKKQWTIVIDAGHGGMDPGKVGVNKANEKDVNLAIAKQLKKLLEKEDINVIMVREEDVGLYEEGSTNKKAEDMKKRCEIIDGAEPVCAISIHQNSYHEAGVKGAQVFYFQHSEEAKKIAECLQKNLIEGLDSDNHRQAKANDTYYLLKKTQSPTVIVECGFLSNWEEAELLVTEKYQKKVAKAICNGILEYLEEK